MPFEMDCPPAQGEGEEKVSLRLNLDPILSASIRHGMHACAAAKSIFVPLLFVEPLLVRNRLRPRPYTVPDFKVSEHPPLAAGRVHATYSTLLKVGIY